jgi:cupin 2 domain-containing protein
MNRGNLFDGIPSLVPDELVEVLWATGATRVERIVSRGHASPPGFWYDQDDDEWVILLSGQARLLVDGEPDAVELRPGDHVLLPAHQRHRVEWTDPSQDTVWLAIHVAPPRGA